MYGKVKSALDSERKTRFQRDGGRRASCALIRFSDGGKFRVR